MSLHSSVSNKTEEESHDHDPETQCECGGTRFIQTCYQTWTEEKVADSAERWAEYQNQEFVETYEWGGWRCEDCNSEVLNSDLIDTLEEM